MDSNTKSNINQAPLDAALHYHSLGWALLPVAAGSKKPHACIQNWRQYQEQGATEEQVRQWWTEYPDAGIAVILGKVSGGLVALDFDGEGAEQLAKEYRLPQPPTAISRTGGGGQHRIYHSTDELATTTTLLKGKDCHVELRAEGSYIVLPSSVHPSGNRYEWAIPPSDGIAELPDAVRYMATPLEKQQAVAEEFPIDILPLRFQGLLAGDYKLRDLWGEPAPDGDQSTRDYALACRCLETGLSEEEVAAILWFMPHGKRQREAAEGAPVARQQRYINRTVVKAAAATGIKLAAAIPPVEEMHYTDTGNALRLTAKYGRDIGYCWLWGKWLAWTGKVWKVGAEDEVLELAKRTVKAMYLEAAKLGDDERAKLVKHALASESAMRRRAMLYLAQSEKEVVCDHKDFDRDPWLLNVRNGTIDLRSGELRPHRREDFITKIALVDYNPRATCPKWQRFLEGIFEGNTQLIQFVQRAAGYSMTGDVSEDAMFFLHGTGANGKTTFFLTLQELLGPYAIEVSPGLLLTRHYESHPTGLVDLFGIRLAVSVEVGEGRRFDEERLKQITGGDRIRARRMREDFWEFSATHKIWLAANEKPRVTGQDYAIWRRIKLIPFNVKFTEPGEPGPDQDPNLRKNLFSDERPGVLNWALEGCLSWQTDGLAAPPEVKAATAEYKQEEDVVRWFIEAECVVDQEARESPTKLFKAFEQWRKDTGGVKLSQNLFGRRLTEKGFESVRDSAGERMRLGIGLKEQPKFEFEE